MQLKRELDNIKVQIIKHYQHLSDREAFVMTGMVRNAYQRFGSEYETLLSIFDKDIASFKKRVGKDRTANTLKACSFHETTWPSSYRPITVAQTYQYWDRHQSSSRNSLPISAQNVVLPMELSGSRACG